ncbi:MAG: Stp1/IreP family PP2C-type Ser/Thr phosphatase [Bacillota bacterium]
MKFESFTTKGNVRKNNEDNFLLKLKPFPLIVVADGMGGHKAGDVASQVAVDLIKNYEFEFEKEILDEIEDLFNMVNKEIITIGSKNPEYKGMGTTLSLALIYNNKLYIGHIGDSRIYIYRNSKLEKITTDDSLVNELIEKGKISKGEAFNHPQKHILTQALGTDYKINIEKKIVELKDNDILLFCTDGLTDMIREEKIEEIIANNFSDINILAKKLGKKALENGGSDNITLITGIIN